MNDIGEPDEGKPHVRFDEGEQGRLSGSLRRDGLRPPLERMETRLVNAWDGWGPANPVPYSTQELTWPNNYQLMSVRRRLLL